MTGNLNFDITSEKRKHILKNWSTVFLVESTKIDSITIPYKTALSEANIKTNRMGTTKLTYYKEQSFAFNNFPFLKILFQFRNLVYRVDLKYQPPKCPYSYFSKALEFYFGVFFSLWASLKSIWMRPK